MHPPLLLWHLPRYHAERRPEARALTSGNEHLTYARLAREIERCAAALQSLGIRRGDRVAVWLDKRPETVIACFGAAAAGAIFVPINPLLKAEQVHYLLRDSGARCLVTAPTRLRTLLPWPDGIAPLALAVEEAGQSTPPEARSWHECLAQAGTFAAPPATEHDVAAILYTSGSTGRPKGVVLSHRNLVAGAQSVASYLENSPDDVLLAALPLSFDAGFSQLTTAFCAGARVVLLNYLLPVDVLRTLEREHVTGLTAVPPLWVALAELDWPASVAAHLRYFANTGGKLPRRVLERLRALAPQAKPYLMYGLTEAFRATYLPPEEIDRRPDSIGRAIPNAEVFVLRDDGTPCAPREVGEIVQRGPLVAQGYWNDPERTAERFRPLPAAVDPRPAQVPAREWAVFSGDYGWLDEEGYLYFAGRRDEMIKTSGYRVSPTEIEEALFASGLVRECCACGLEDERLGQIIAVALQPAVEPFDPETLRRHCRQHLPPYQVPHVFLVSDHPLPRNPNGKLDRPAIRERLARHHKTKTHP